MSCRIKMLYWGTGPLGKNEKTTSHTHDFCQLELAIRGTNFCRSGKDKFLFADGEGLFIPPGHAHSFSRSDQSDDSHYYGEGNLADSCTSSIMVNCSSLDHAALKEAILAGKFYATTGPEIHINRHGDTIRVDCSAVSEIAFLSNISWSPRVFLGNGLTHAEYPLHPCESFVHACLPF